MGLTSEAPSSAPSRSLHTQYHWRRPINARVGGACRTARDQAVKTMLRVNNRATRFSVLGTWGYVKILPDAKVPVHVKIRPAGPLKKMPLSCTTAHNPHASDNFTSRPNFHGRFPFPVCLLLSAALRALLRFSSEYRRHLDFRHISSSRRQDERRGKNTVLLPFRIGIRQLQLHQLHQTPNPAGVKLLALALSPDSGCCRGDAIATPDFGCRGWLGPLELQPVCCQPPILRHEHLAEYHVATVNQLARVGRWPAGFTVGSSLPSSAWRKLRSTPWQRSRYNPDGC